MFVIFSSPIAFTKSYREAWRLADKYYNKTGQIVAVEKVNNSRPFHVPSV